MKGHSMTPKTPQTQRNTPAALGAIVIAMGMIVPAQAIVIPPSLNPGDQYRLAFVTAGTRNALSSDIAVYNAFVNAQAQLSVLTADATWFAIGSTVTVDARDNTNTNPNVGTGVPIFLVDGTTIIADDNADLWDGSLDGPLDTNQHGISFKPFDLSEAWTGSLTDGIAALGRALGSNPTIISGSPVINFGTQWIKVNEDDPDILNHLYALSTILSVPAPPQNNTGVPEPATAGLAALGVTSLLMSLRRRRSADG